MVEEIRALGVPVVGDLDELLPGEPLTGRDPSTVTDSELLALCTQVVVELGASQHERIQELRDQGERPRSGGSDGLQGRVHEALGRLREAGLQRVQRRLGRG
jgi:hypothetical protein